MNSACMADAHATVTSSTEGGSCVTGDLAATVLLGATMGEMSPLAKIRDELSYVGHSAASVRSSDGAMSHCLQHIRRGTHLSPSPRGGTNSSFLSPMCGTGLGTDFSTMNSVASPMIRMMADDDDCPVTAAAADADTDTDAATATAIDAAVTSETLPATNASPINDFSPPRRVPPPSPASGNDCENRPAHSNSLIEGSFRRSAAPSMVWSGGHNASSMRLDGSTLAQTTMLGQSAMRQMHNASPAIAVSSSTPIVPCPENGDSNSNADIQEACSTRAAGDSSIMRETLRNSINEGGANIWKRVKLVSLASVNVLDGSPVPKTPVDTVPLAGTGVSSQRNRARSPSRNSRHPTTGNPDAENSFSLSSALEGCTPCSDVTVQRECSPSRPLSSVADQCETSRQLNLSLMSGSMSFRPPVSTANSIYLPKGSPLTLDGSLQAGTPTSSMALQRPTPRKAACGTNAVSASSQFRTVFCGRRGSLVANGEQPLARDVVETGKANRSGGGGGGSWRSCATGGHNFVDLYDAEALAKRRPPTTKVTDTSMFGLWSPLGLDQEAPAALAADLASAVQDLESPKTHNNKNNNNKEKKRVGDDKSHNGDQGKDTLDSMRRPPAAITTVDASEFAFSMNESDSCLDCSTDTVATMETGLLSMQLHGGSISVPATQFAAGPADKESNKVQEE